MRSLLGMLVAVAVLASACQDDRGLTILNACGVEIEFFMYEATATSELNDLTIGDPIRMDAAATRHWTSPSNVQRVEIYSEPRDLVLSVPTDHGEDIEMVIDSGCDILEVRSG